MTLKRKVQAVVFSLFALVVVLIGIRVFFIFINEDSTASIVRFWNDTLTQPIIEPFLGIYNNYFIEGLRLETASFLAILFYLLVAYIAARFVGAFFPPNPKLLIIDLIDVLFKVVEFTLILRLLFRLTNASRDNDFVDMIYSVSSVFYEPFRNILPSLSFGDFGNYIFETSTFIAIILIIVFDLIAEGFLRNILNANEEDIIADERRRASLPAVRNINVAPIAYQPAVPQPMNITVNVPQGQQAGKYTVEHYHTGLENINKPNNR